MRSGKRKGKYHHGEDHVEHKLTDKEVLEIRQLAEDGAKQIWLAKKYGVSQATVSKIINGFVWQHLFTNGGQI